MRTVIFTLFGMHCTSCAMNIDGELEDLDGVKSSVTNYAKQQTKVTFDPKKVTIANILTTIRGVDGGYDAEVMK